MEQKAKWYESLMAYKASMGTGTALLLRMYLMNPAEVATAGHLVEMGDVDQAADRIQRAFSVDRRAALTAAVFLEAAYNLTRVVPPEIFSIGRNGQGTTH